MIRHPIGRLYDTLLTQIEKQKIPIEPKRPHNFEFGSKELINMIGLPPREGESVIVQLLEDKNMALEGGKIICKDMAELEKTVSFYKKQSSLERKREASKNK
jgi:CRP/FNR family transcriptional regulator